MATFEITDNTTGFVFEIEGDRPPTQQEVRDLIAGMDRPIVETTTPQITLERRAQAIPSEGAQGPTLEDSGLVTPLIQGQRVAPVSPLIAGIDRGIASRLQGVAQLVLEGLNKLGAPVDETLAELNRKVQEEITAFDPIDREFVSARIGKFLGDFGLTALIPGGATIKGAAAAGAALGATEFVQPGQDRLENIVIGGGTGAGASAALKGTAILGTRAINSIRGNFNDEAQELTAIARQRDIPISVGDITQQPLIQKAELISENFPAIGFSGFRQTQQKAAAREAQILMDGFSVTGDWAQIIQTSLVDRAGVIRQSAGKLFNKVGRLADPLGPVPVPRMNNAASKILEEEKAKVFEFQDKQLIDAISKYSINPNANFSSLSSIRSDLADDISDYFSGKNQIVGKKGVEKLQKIKNAINEDMDKFAQQQGGQIKVAWDRANSFWETKVIPFKDRAIANASKNSTPDEIFKSFIKRGARDRAQNFFNALDKRGKNAVRFGMLEDAMTKATSEGRPFSPARFARAFEDNQAAFGVFFKGKDKKEIAGFTKLMRHIERAGQFAENPPTGQRAIPLLLGGGFIFSPQIAGGIVSASLLVKGLFGTEAGKRLLLSANTIKIGSKAMQGLVSGINRLVPRGAAISGLETDQPLVQ